MEGTIEGNFQTIFQRCKNNDYSSYKEEDLLRLIHEIEELLRVISQEGFFSKNEEFDDVSTESLKVKNNIILKLRSILFYSIFFSSIIMENV